MNNKSLVLSVLTLGVAIFAAAIWYQNQPVQVAAVEPMPSGMAEAMIRDYSPVLGADDAPVTIVEFFDPACEACRAFHPIVKEILAEHEGNVRVVLRYTPFHGAASEEAIRVMEAARMQNIYLPVMDAILAEQPRWASHGAPEPGLVLSIAERAGLDVEAARGQMLAPQILTIINQDRADVETVGVRQTPTFYVNGKLLDPFGANELRAAVSAEVGAAGS